MEKLLLFLIRFGLFRRLINPGHKNAGTVDKGTIAIFPGTWTRLGDMVMYNHSIQQLQRRYTVLFIVSESFYSKFKTFLSDHSPLKDIVVIPANKWKWPAFILRLRARKIQAAIYDQVPVAGEALSYLAGVPVIVSSRGSSPFANREFSVNYDLHYTERANLIFETLGAGKMDIQLSPFLRYRHIDLPEVDGYAGITLVVHSGGGNFWMRKWPLENFYETCRRFLEIYRGRVFLIGGKEEAETNEKMRSRLLDDGFTADRVVNFSGDPLNTLFNIIVRGTVFLGNDSGPMNCAVALGKRVICIFGPSQMRIVNPTQFDKRNITIHADLDCVPCNNVKCRLEEDRKYICLTQLAVEPVWEALQTTLKDHSGMRFTDKEYMQ